MKKFVSTILIIAAISSIASVIFFYKIPKAQAIFGIGDFTVDIVNQVKEWVLDQLPKTVARQMMIRLQQEIARWAQGGFSDENKPFAMTDWNQELKNIADVASAKFIRRFELTPLCAPIRVALGTALGFNMPYGVVPYEIYGACTLQNVVNNVEEFYKNPSIAVYGWDTWTALTQPQNNFLGSAVMALGAKQEIQNEETDATKQELQAGGGYKNDAICTQDDLDACIEHCPDDVARVFGNPRDEGLWNYYCGFLKQDPKTCVLEAAGVQEICEGEKCARSTTGVCVNEQVKKLGSEIKTSIDETIGSDIKWLITADEITEMLNLVFSGLFNKLIQGTGLSTKPYYASNSQIAKDQAQYGYQYQFKKNQTPEDLQKLRIDILDSISSAIKKLSTNTYECDNDKQIKGEVVQEMNTEIIDEESKHLYTGTEGVDLKPDFFVLDPPGLPETATIIGGGSIANVPIKLYGSTWDEIPFAKYPTKCQQIAGKECKNILNKLPFELDLNNIKYQGTIGCSSCLAKINEERSKCNSALTECKSQCESNSTILKTDPKKCKDNCSLIYETCSNKVFQIAVDEGKCADINHGKLCLAGGLLINKTQNICDDCFNQAQTKCESKTTTAEKTKCIETYCSGYEDINNENVDPNFIKISGANDFYGRCQLSITKNNCNVCLKEYFMPFYYCDVIYDFINRSMVKYPIMVYDTTWYGGKKISCSSNNSSGGQIFRAETCRIMPDFRFPDGKTCFDSCKVTEEELKNTFDDEPRNDECSPQKWTANAYEPAGLWTEYLTVKQARCCVLSVGTKDQAGLQNFAECRGIQPSTATCTWGKPVQDEPQCYCDEGYRPLGFTRTGDPSRGNGPAMGGDCGNFSFQNPKKSDVYGYTNARTTGDKVYIGTTSCGETTPDRNGDAMAPANGTTLLSEKTPNGINSHGPYRIDLSAVAANTLNAGVYNVDNNNANASTGWTVCAKCDSSDSGYPYYGYSLNQCSGKTTQ